MIPYDQIAQIEAIQKQLDPLRSQNVGAFAGLHTEYANAFDALRLTGATSDPYGLKKLQDELNGTWRADLFSTAIPRTISDAIAQREEIKANARLAVGLPSTADSAQQLMDAYHQAAALLNPL